MSAENLALLRRYVAIYNDGAWDRLGDVLTADYVHHSNAASLTTAEFVRGAEWIRAGIPDFTVEVADMFSDSDRVAVRFVGRGTHSASMFGEPPSDRRITLYGTTIFRIVDGRIAEDWEAMDEADLRRQVGAPGA